MPSSDPILAQIAVTLKWIQLMTSLIVISLAAILILHGRK